MNLIASFLAKGLGYTLRAPPPPSPLALTFRQLGLCKIENLSGCQGTISYSRAAQTRFVTRFSDLILQWQLVAASGWSSSRCWQIRGK